MKEEMIQQFGHAWRAFKGIVRDFDPVSWFCTGRGVITPARLAFHVLGGVKYYIEDPSPVVFPSGKPLTGDWVAVQEEDLPSQDDILACIEDFQAKTETWLSGMNFLAENSAFPWAGRTRLGLAIFLLKHCVFHIGEISSLLNESRNGQAQDNWVKALHG